MTRPKNRVVPWDDNAETFLEELKQVLGNNKPPIAIDGKSLFQPIRIAKGWRLFTIYFLGECPDCGTLVADWRGARTHIDYHDALDELFETVNTLIATAHMQNERMEWMRQRVEYLQDIVTKSGLEEVVLAEIVDDDDKEDGEETDAVEAPDIPPSISPPEAKGRDKEHYSLGLIGKPKLAVRYGRAYLRSGQSASRKVRRGTGD